jgi:TolB-like protein
VGRSPHRGNRSGGWLAVIGLLAVVGGALWWSLSDRLSSLWQRWAGSAPDPVILVAPLEVAAPQRQYWSGGLAHDLAMRLGQIPGLTVVGRTGFDARREGDTGRWTRRPQALLTGALDFQDGRVLLEVELLDLRDRRALWTERYASETSAIFATQTEIAEAVARALRLPLEPSPARARKKSHRVSEGSYELYLRGRDRAAAGDAAGALEFYEQAAVDGAAFAELDAAYADALYQALSEGGPGDLLGAQARLREAATRAAAADPDLPQAALAHAMASASFEESLEHVRRAIELDPSLGAAYRLVAHLLTEIDSERALRFAERALELDPGSVSAALDLVNADARLDRFDEAERWLDSLRDRLPGGGWAARLAMLRFEQAQHEAGLQAVADAGEFGRRPMLALVTISARHRTGGAEQAWALTEELTRATPAFCEARAIEVALQIDRGDRRAARVGAERLIGEAAAADAPPRALGCAAMAAAGIHDAASAAALLRRVAQSNVALPAWLFQIDGISVQTLFRRGWYPWDQVARDPDVASAAAALEQRIGEWRNAVAGMLDRLLERPRISANR